MMAMRIAAAKGALSLKKDEEAGFRTWTQTVGKSKSSFVARLVEFKGGKLRLEHKDGSVVEVPIGKLSTADQKYTREESKRRRAEP